MFAQDMWIDERDISPKEEEMIKEALYKQQVDNIDYDFFKSFGATIRNSIYKDLKSLIGLFTDQEVYDIAADRYEVDEMELYAWLGMKKSWDRMFDLGKFEMPNMELDYDEDC